MRKVLFTKMVTLKTADLPRWRPKGILTDREIKRMKRAEEESEKNDKTDL